MMKIVACAKAPKNRDYYGVCRRLPESAMNLPNHVYGSVSAEPSNARIFLASLVIGALVFCGSGGVDLYLLKHGHSARNMLLGSDLFGGLIAFAIFMAYARASRDRNKYLRNQLEVVAGLNHNIRNALAAISMSNYVLKSPEFVIIREGVEKIERSLNEYVPMDVDGRRIANRRIS
jgi:hypothetical protein